MVKGLASRDMIPKGKLLGLLFLMDIGAFVKKSKTFLRLLTIFSENCLTISPDLEHIYKLLFYRIRFVLQITPNFFCVLHLNDDGITW